MIKKFISRAVLTLAVFGCLGNGIVSIVHAGNVPLDVSASNVSGVASKDPYSRMESKSNAEQKFYIKLTSLKNGPSLSFTSYSSAHQRVSNALKYTASYVGTTKKHSYDIQTALAGAKYYVYTSAPAYYANVHGIGTYCP